MSDPKTVYRSLAPERSAPAVKAAKTARSAALDAIGAFTDDLFSGPQSNGEPYPQMTATASFHFDGSIYVTGFAVTDGSTSSIEPPLGLRYDKKSKHLVPAKTTPEGKALAKRIDTLDFRHPRIEGLGGIVHGYNGDMSGPRHLRQGYFTGWTFHAFTRESGAVEIYATLPVEHLDERDQEAVLTSGEHWEKVRLSAFHAAREEHQDQANDLLAQAAAGPS